MAASIVDIMERKLDDKFSQRSPYLTECEKREIYIFIMNNPSPPLSLLKKFTWYNSIPLRFDDDSVALWTSFTILEA